jgi:hypothetical protein
MNLRRLQLAPQCGLILSSIVLACTFAAFWGASAQDAPCCLITAIDPRTTTLTAEVRASGQSFAFRPKDPKLVSVFKVGQPVYANFKTGQVSLDGRVACCTITEGPTAATAKPTASSQNSKSSTAFGSLNPGRTNPKPEYGPVVSAVGCAFPPSKPDLLVRAVGFNSTRHVAYTVENCGQAATQLPFIVDIFVNDERRDTVEHQPLPALAEQSVTSKLAQHQGCDPVRLKAVADPQQIVEEAAEANNVRVMEITPPCPDLAVDEIKQDWEDANTRYTVQVKVGNHGNGPSEVTVAVRAYISGPGFSIPELQWPEVPPLAPGQSHIFHLNGKHLATSQVSVALFVDFYKQLVEPNRENNVAAKTLGPH